MAKPPISNRGVTALDAIIAERISTRRRQLGLSQQRLAALVGVTFQQIQKYEKGANRVAASRLYDIARALDEPLSYFFDPIVNAKKGPKKASRPIGSRQPAKLAARPARP